MKITVIYTTLLLIFAVVNSAIVFPDDVTTIAQILYSLIPPVKIGQDSRVGVGFRVGNNADAQVLLELGPQSNTDPLAAGADKDTSKRQTLRPRPSYTAAGRKQIIRGLLERMRSSLATPESKPSAEERGEKS